MNESDVTSLGEWVSIFLTLVVLLVPLVVMLAWWLKLRYASNIVRLQREVTPAEQTSITCNRIEPEPGPHYPSTALLQVHFMSAEAVQELKSESDSGASARALRRRVLLLQIAFGLLVWVTLLVALLSALVIVTQPENDPESATGGISAVALASQWVQLISLVCLPVLFAWALEAGLRERLVWIGFGVAAAIIAASEIVLGSTALAALYSLLAVAAVGVMISAFMRPAVRGAGPPLLAALCVGMIAFAVVALTLDALIDENSMWGRGRPGYYVVWALIIAVGLAAAWTTLIWIARCYETKRFSNQQLAGWGYWGLLSLVVLAMVLYNVDEGRHREPLLWIAGTALIVLTAVHWMSKWVLCRVMRGAPASLGPLLMLRVFKPSSRSEAFMDRFAARWRFMAPAWMIAGPDLAGAYMEPDEFFAYLRGDLCDRFIDRSSIIEERVAHLDDQRDPDGRFRISELFCANHIWQQTVLALMNRASVVMIDLREYSEKRAGTHFELCELLRREPLEKALFLTDANADRANIEAVLRSAWESVRERRRLPTDGTPKVTVLQLGPDSERQIAGLLRAVAQVSTLTCAF